MFEFVLTVCLVCLDRASKGAPIVILLSGQERFSRAIALGTLSDVLSGDRSNHENQ